MRIDELAALCREAAGDLLTRSGRPVPAALVLPDASATRVLTLPEFPAEPSAQRDFLAGVVQHELLPREAPGYGFVCEALAERGGLDVDVVMVAYGARGHHPQVTAAPLEDDRLGLFADAEPVDFAALPFLEPLQRAVDSVRPREGPLDGR